MIQELEIQREELWFLFQGEAAKSLEVRELHMSLECCEGRRTVKFSRRYFMKQGGIAMVGLSTMPAFLQRAIAATPSSGKKQLVVLFQRGAADGLNIVIPFGEHAP